MKSSVPSSPAFAAGKVRAAPAHTDQQSVGSMKSAPAPEVLTPFSDSAPESSNNIIEEGLFRFLLRLNEFLS